MSNEPTHQPNCAWEQTTSAECDYRETHYYCPHLEHTCTCPATAPTTRTTPSAETVFTLDQLTEALNQERAVWSGFLHAATGLKPSGDDSADDWAGLLGSELLTLRHRSSAEEAQRVGFMQVGPGGICFAHGPYTDSDCPDYDCEEIIMVNGPNPKYVALAEERARQTNKVYTQAQWEEAQQREIECVGEPFAADPNKWGHVAQIAMRDETITRLTAENARLVAQNEVLQQWHDEVGIVAKQIAFDHGGVVCHPKAIGDLLLKIWKEHTLASSTREAGIREAAAECDVIAKRERVLWNTAERDNVRIWAYERMQAACECAEKVRALLTPPQQPKETE